MCDVDTKPTMKLLFYISIGLMVLCILALLYAYHLFTAKEWRDTDFAMISIGTLRIRAEIAAHALKKSAGLSTRSFLAEDGGMLFIFSEPYRYPFWMKGMRIPLDFVWIQDGIVVDITKNVQSPNKGEFPATVRPSDPVTMVLEVNAGILEKFGIKIGDAVHIDKI